MEYFKAENKDFLIFLFIIFLVTLIGLISHDYYIAIISAICGLSYTFLAGKGLPSCYLFGLLSSFLYIFLAFKNCLWGNFALYAFYYVPMQTFGFFQWQKHLKTNTNEVVKISISKKELRILISSNIIGIVLLTICLYHFNDIRPILDSVMTILSLSGMYLTVKRAIEQWIFWILVNFSGLLVWSNLALLGNRVYTTAIMWGVYLILAFYFYFKWKKELEN